MGPRAPKKQYVTLWRPDGDPMSVNIGDKVQGPKRVEELLQRGYSRSKPAVTGEMKRAKAAKEQKEADKKAEVEKAQKVIADAGK